MSNEKIVFFNKLSGLLVDPDSFDYFVMGGCVYRDNFRTCESQSDVVSFCDFIVNAPEIGWRSVDGDDAKRLDFLDKKGGNWVARESGLGRGYRLHQSEKHDSHPTARAAIDAAMKSEDAS